MADTGSSLSKHQRPLTLQSSRSTRHLTMAPLQHLLLLRFCLGIGTVAHKQVFPKVCFQRSWRNGHGHPSAWAPGKSNVPASNLRVCRLESTPQQSLRNKAGDALTYHFEKRLDHRKKLVIYGPPCEAASMDTGSPCVRVVSHQRT